VPTFEWFIDEGVGKALTGSSDAIEIVDALDLDGINVRPNYSRKLIDSETFVDEWGATRKLTGDAIAAVVESPITDITRHADFKFIDPAAPHRLATLERVFARFDNKRAVVFNVRDGWSDMRDLLGYENSLMSFLDETNHFRALLDRVVEYNLALARIAKERFGIEVVATTDDIANANGLLLRPQHYLDIIGPAFKKVIRGFKDLGLFCIKHSDGDTTALMDFWIECGIDCFDPVDPTAGLSMGVFKQRYGDRICLKGNINCAGVLETGTEEEVRRDVRDCIAQGGRSGLIVSSSNTIHRGVKAANFRAMIEAVREFGRASN
jgi:uroporphyrinogen decarboxylase